MIESFGAPAERRMAAWPAAGWSALWPRGDLGHPGQPQRLDLGREQSRHRHDADDALYRGELAQLTEDQSDRVAKEFFAR